jgi:DNA topoisomerase-1
MKILVIVESPSKVHTVSEILKELGYTKAVVLASVGHTTRIKDVRDSYKNTGIYPKEDFRIEWEIDPEKRKIIENLRAQARICDLVLIASDPDREGESLGNHIKNLLNLDETQYYRIKYHSITRAEIQKALENPEKMNKALCDAAESRQIVDKMLGYALSPVAKAYVGARSVGRCQSAGLKLVADREREIQNFVPEYYYDLFLHFVKNNAEFKAKYVGTASEKVDKITSTALLNDIKFACGGDFVLTDKKVSTRKESPKPPFCTATFQQEAATKLNLKIKDAMSCAQKLFEAGRISYMRTDSTAIANDFLPGLKAAIEQTYGAGMYKKPTVGVKATNAQEGHEALRITDPTLTPEEFAKLETKDLLVKVYKLIWQRTLASAMPPAEYAETSYTVINNGHLFKFAHKELTKLGYKVLYSVTDEPKKATEAFSIGEVLEKPSLEEQKKETLPPPRFTEATLVKELQQLGIGRPSTYAQIVETLLSPKRGYCDLINKDIIPTTKGLQLSSFLDRAFSSIINLNYTKQLEDSLDAIANKQFAKLDFLRSFFISLEDSISANKENVDDVMQYEQKFCPYCGEEMILRRSRYGKLFYGCSTYPVCKGILNFD